VAGNELCGESEHPRAHGVAILHDVVVAYAHDDDSEAPQNTVSLQVHVATIVVDGPVDFDSQLE